MFKNLRNKKLLFIFIAIILLIAALLSLKLLFRTDIPKFLKSLGYDVEIRDIIFQDYDSQKISAKKNSEKILLQIVKNVEKDSSDEILKKLEIPIESAQKDIIVFDAYSGAEKELSVPDELKPVKKEIVIEAEPLVYYVVYLNEILSLRILSEVEVKYKGLFTSYYCSEEKVVYALQVYYDIEDFDEEKAINVLSSLFCGPKK